DTAALDMVRAAFGPDSSASGEHYYLGFLRRPAASAGPGRLYLWFDAQATSTDILLGFHHAMACRALLGSSSGDVADAAGAQAQSYLFAKQTFSEFHRAVADSGWETGTVYLAKQSALVELERRA
ncbi:hypothetical protein H4R19_004188, partial [Coemansia spiralis]